MLRSIRRFAQTVHPRFPFVPASRPLGRLSLPGRGCGVSAPSRFLAVAAAFVVTLPALAHAGRNLVALTGQEPGATPFISIVSVAIDNPASLTSYKFSVQPKPGSHTRALSAQYTGDYLQRRGFIDPTSKAGTLPVFGLYAGYTNTVTLTFQFVDGHSEEDTLSIETKPYHAPTYNHPKIVQARTPDSTLSYDFIFLKNYDYVPSPVMLDTDGEVRWVGVLDVDALSSTLYKNSIYVAATTVIFRMEFDGAVTLVQDEAGTGISGFFHNLDFGRDGLLADVDTPTQVESTIMEFNADGISLHIWSLSSIISAAMIAGGDDPAQFVQASPVDWFHSNSATYRSSDNSLIVSSRENFVIALDYDSGAIKWILGDDTKKWYQFPSLRKYALKLAPGSHPPIGQHALSVFYDRLLLFDDGEGSAYQMPPGKTRSYSAPRMYAIHQNTSTATEIWNFNNEKNVFSPFCSSVYADQPNNYLIDYTLSHDEKKTKLVGLDATGNKVFDYEYAANDSCATGWNAFPIHLEDLSFY